MAKVKLNPFKGHYKQAVAYDLGSGRHFVVQYGKEYPTQIWNGRVDTFPSRYDSFDAFASDIAQIIGDFDEPEICRLDFTRSFDSKKYPWKWFMRRLYVPRWHKFKLFQKGFAIGNYPHRISAYKHPLPDGSTRTHLELQLSGKECPIGKLNQFSSLLKCSAYKQWEVEFLNLDVSYIRTFDLSFMNSAGINTLGGPQLAHLEKIHALRDMIKERGYYCARKAFNRSGNFVRYGTYFAPSKKVSARSIDLMIGKGVAEFCSHHKTCTNNITEDASSLHLPNSLTMPLEKSSSGTP